MARLDPRAGLYPSTRVDVALSILLVVAAEEGPPLAGLRSVHPDHRDPVRSALIRFIPAVGLLPLPRGDTRVD